MCDVCSERPEVGVASIPGIPCSVAYCQECLKANAHPWWAMVAGTVINNGLDNCAEWWKEMVFATIKHLGRTMAEFEADVVKDIRG